MKIFKVNDKKTIEKIVTLLSFASRSKKLVYGKENIREYIKTGNVVIVVSNVGERVRRDILTRCEMFNCKIVLLEGLTKESLAKRLGMVNLSVVGVKDKGIINGIIEVVERGGASGKTKSI